jgi:ATP-dependent RNA helicase SUPV3L1/SUV3
MTHQSSRGGTGERRQQRAGEAPRPGPHSHGEPGRITAVLGPTNTGKTHLAIERMLGHRSGMIGLPLRLLAREVYDKICRMRGPREVALITGEERIVPAEPRFFVCTVEAMPVDIPVAFLAIDEIQLCADLERGHVFTDRLLHARGTEETMLLGAATMRGAIQRIAPHAQFVTRPRFSDLTYTGSKKLTRLPRRSAVVAFSAEDVYRLADLVRSQRGGAAVVMGALSPRTRNAQVALYQSGDADFLIATDAIGMGINMDVDHVAFAALSKFDGVTIRPLRPEEIGQIAGRAGRYMNDGTFGVTADTDPLDSELVAQVEGHRYEPVRVLQWRNSALDFTSVNALLASLEAPPPLRGLTRARVASDHWTLRALFQEDSIRDAVNKPSKVRLLWETCQLPDFRKLTPDEHARLVALIFGHLSQDGVLPEDWMARQIARLDITEGEVDTLSGRLAQIRTWTYAAHRPTWTRDPSHWQELTRAVEDRLSDALHEKLTQRFIDRRTSLLMRHMRDDDVLTLAVDESGAVTIADEYTGNLAGFHFSADPRAEGIHGRTLRAAALRGLEHELIARARAILTAPDSEIQLSEHAQLWWRDAPVAKLIAGAHPLQPGLVLLADDHLKGEWREAVKARLDTWLHAHIEKLLEPLTALRRSAETKNTKDGTGLTGLTRGLAFQMAEGLGQLHRDIPSMPQDLRDIGRALRRFGVRIGRHTLYFPRLLKPAPSSLIALLWTVHRRIDPIPTPPPPGVTSFVIEAGHSKEFLAAAFFRVIAGRAVRLDILERMEDTLFAAARAEQEAEIALKMLTSFLGASQEEALAMAGALEWERVALEREGVSRMIWRRREKRRKGHKQRRRTNKAKPYSPFAGLKALIPAD